MSASTSALTPAGWVLTSSHRSWSRCNDSLSPSGKAASRRVLSCTSGSSRTASTRLARLPGGMCPDSARKEARTVRSGPDEMVTSAAATVCSPSLISTCRCPLCSTMLCLLAVDSLRGEGSGPRLVPTTLCRLRAPSRTDNALPAPCDPAGDAYLTRADSARPKSPAYPPLPEAETRVPGPADPQTGLHADSFRPLAPVSCHHQRL